MFIVEPLTAKRDERRNMFVVELRTKNYVHESCHGGDLKMNLRCHVPLNEGKSQITHKISRGEAHHYRPRRLPVFL